LLSTWTHHEATRPRPAHGLAHRSDRVPPELVERRTAVGRLARRTVFARPTVPAGRTVPGGRIDAHSRRIARGGELGELLTRHREAQRPDRTVPEGRGPPRRARDDEGHAGRHEPALEVSERRVAVRGRLRELEREPIDAVDAAVRAARHADLDRVAT